jgi:hypothetical protein
MSSTIAAGVIFFSSRLSGRTMTRCTSTGPATRLNVVRLNEIAAGDGGGGLRRA